MSLCCKRTESLVTDIDNHTFDVKLGAFDMGFVTLSIIFMSCQSQYSESTKVDETSNTISEEVSKMWDGEVFVTYAKTIGIV